jgi:hypothetical protein
MLPAPPQPNKVEVFIWETEGMGEGRRERTVPQEGRTVPAGIVTVGTARLARDFSLSHNPRTNI